MRKEQEIRKSLDDTEKEVEKVKENFEKWLIDCYGEKCPEYEKGCALCEIWRNWELLKEKL